VSDQLKYLSSTAIATEDSIARFRGSSISRIATFMEPSTEGIKKQLRRIFDKVARAKGRVLADRRFLKRLSEDPFTKSACGNQAQKSISAVATKTTSTPVS
jgi:hypothetical protein